MPFWTNDETEKYVFADNYLDFFGPECPPIDSSVQDWDKIRAWAIENGHTLCLVSAQRPHCEEPTTEWLKKYGFIFDEIHYTKNKFAVDVDVLIDDSPEKLNDFKTKSVTGGTAICYKQTWNAECHNDYISIDKLSDIMTKVFG